jgi:hypothetical protein
VLRTALGDMLLSSKLSKTTVGGLAHLHSSVSAAVTAVSVTVNAAAALELRSGALSIAMKPGSLDISGDVKMDAPEIKVTGNVDNLTG